MQRVFHSLLLASVFHAVYTWPPAPPSQLLAQLRWEINALLKGNKWRIWGEPFEIEMQSEGARLDVVFFFSHINMCLSGPSPPSGGGPQHQMEPRLACVSSSSTCHQAASHCRPPWFICCCCCCLIWNVTSLRVTANTCHQRLGFFFKKKKKEREIDDDEK